MGYASKNQSKNFFSEVDMINLTKDEFAQVIHEVIKELDMPDITFALITIGAMIGARAEMKTEEKEAEKESEKEEYEAIIEYRAGKWIIRISTLESDKVRLRVYRNEVAVCDRILDSLYKAYNYAFNIICL